MGNKQLCLGVDVLEGQHSHREIVIVPFRVGVEPKINRKLNVLLFAARRSVTSESAFC